MVEIEFKSYKIAFFDIKPRFEVSRIIIHSVRDKIDCFECLHLWNSVHISSLILPEITANCLIIL